jgi:hypothetical protein
MATQDTAQEATPVATAEELEPMSREALIRASVAEIFASPEFVTQLRSLFSAWTYEQAQTQMANPQPSY